MKLTLICSCGLLLEQDGRKLLVDGLTDELPPYESTKPEDRQRILEALAPFDGLCALAVTHHHPDHWSSVWTAELLRRQPDVQILDPSQDGVLHAQTDIFSVSFFSLPHVPTPPQYAVRETFAALISAGGKTVYAASDAVADAELHRAVLGGRHVDAAFWNGQMLSFASTRTFLAEAAVQNFIYHIPIDEKDVSGIRRKCERCFSRSRAELPNVTLLETYPTSLEL